jgi:hypothetical protein
MKFLRRMFGLTLLGVICFFAAPGHAETTSRLDRLDVAIWPEYDRSAVLVIYKAFLNPLASFPTSITLPIPAAVGEPHAVASMAQDDMLVDSDYVRSVEGAWAMITLETDQPEVWVEFYADYAKVGQDREYTFEWPGGLEIDSFTYEVRQPLAAQNFKIVPSGQVSQSLDGMTVHQTDLGYVSASKDITIDIRYTRAIGGVQRTIPQLEGAHELDSLKVSLWPEYDRPAALVIYQALLPADVPLPARVSLPIPTVVGEPHAVAIQDSRGDLLSVDFERRVQGEWSTITVEAESPLVWMEYYSDLVVEEGQRSYSFIWPGGLDMDIFLFEIQQPVTASDFLVTPVGVTQSEEGGVIYHRGSMFPKSLSTDIAISLTYSNPTASHSIDFMESGSALIRPKGTQGRTPSLAEWLPWALGGLGAILVFLGIIFYIRLNRGPIQPRRRGRMQDSQPMFREGISEDLDAAAIYCHQCGTKAAITDRFCRKCGTRLRT